MGVALQKRASLEDSARIEPLEDVSDPSLRDQLSYWERRPMRWAVREIWKRRTVAIRN
jgi:hypothetical protein